MYLRGYPSHHDSQETTRQLQSGIVPGTTTCTRLAATEPIDRFRYCTVGASSRCSETIERGSPSSVSECGGFHSSPQGRTYRCRKQVFYYYYYYCVSAHLLLSLVLSLRMRALRGSCIYTTPIYFQFRTGAT